MFPYDDSKTVSVCLSVHEYYSMETQKIDFFFFEKSSKLNFVRTLSVCTPRKEIALASSISVLH